MLYRVRIGRDEYLGRADEVVAFLMRTEGAPGRDPRSYMEGVARRLEQARGTKGVRTSDPVAFLESLGALGVVPVERRPEPSEERVAPEEALGEGPIAFGPGAHPDDPVVADAEDFEDDEDDEDDGEVDEPPDDG